MPPLGLAPSQLLGRQPCAPQGVASGLPGLGPGPHPDDQVLGHRLGPMPQG